jgi:hypothetical protein
VGDDWSSFTEGAVSTHLSRKRQKREMQGLELHAWSSFHPTLSMSTLSHPRRRKVTFVTEKNSSSSTDILGEIGWAERHGWEQKQRARQHQCKGGGRKRK